MSSDNGHPFWQWSLEAYERSGVQNRLIYLQDDFGFDVNIALWCCWRAKCGETLNEASLRQAEGAVSEWTEGVIELLRGARRNAKASSADLYAKLKAVELAAERVAQDRLFSVSTEAATSVPADVHAVAKHNLSLYASHIDAPRREGFSSALLRDLIDHIFPGQDGKAHGTH